MPDWFVTTTIGRRSSNSKIPGTNANWSDRWMEPRSTLMTPSRSRKSALLCISLPCSSAGGPDDLAMPPYRDRLLLPAFASSSLRGARLAHDPAGAEARHQVDEDDLATVGFDQLAAHDLLVPVIATLDEYLRAHAADQIDGGILIEHND